MTNINDAQHAAPNSGEAIGPPCCLNDFVGQWQLSRRIVQHSGDPFLFEGKAEFSWHDNTLHYQEAGQVIAPNGNAFLAERAYIWQQSSKGIFDVLFDDNRYFHSFSVAVPYAEHLCGEDRYNVAYTFTQWPDWESLWQVKGPRKDYEMVSRYRRWDGS